MGFNIIVKRDPRNCHFEALRSGISDAEKVKINSTFTSSKDRNNDFRWLRTLFFENFMRTRHIWKCIRFESKL